VTTSPWWSVSVSEGPADAPLTLAQAKAQCGVGADVTDDDALLDGYTAAAAELVEAMTDRALLTQTCIYTASGFPCEGEAIVLPRPPLQSVTSVQYRDTAGVLQTWDPSQYRIVTTGRFGAIVPAYGVCYPWTTCVPDAVTVTFVCGWATAAEIPGRLMLAQQQLVAHWYAKREIDGGQGLGLESLIGAPARVDPCW
jgi:uncharacterized phiE125 gp8 family phage protein